MQIKKNQPCIKPVITRIHQRSLIQNMRCFQADSTHLPRYLQAKETVNLIVRLLVKALTTLRNLAKQLFRYTRLPPICSNLNVMFAVCQKRIHPRMKVCDWLMPLWKVITNLWELALLKRWSSIRLMRLLRLMACLIFKQALPKIFKLKVRAYSRSISATDCRHKSQP